MAAHFDDGWGTPYDEKTYIEAYEQLEIALCEPLDRVLEKADVEKFRPKFKNHQEPKPIMGGKWTAKGKKSDDDDYRDAVYHFDPHALTSESEIDDHERKKTYFRPPLQMQRNAFVRNVLMNFKKKSSMDIGRLGIMGCGEMSLERGLSEYLGSLGTMQVFSVDIDEESLSIGQQLLEKHLTEYAELHASETGLPVLMRSFVGDILQPDHRFANMDAIVSMEVVEHIPLADAKKFVNTVLGVLIPRIFIFSTPNHEYNIVFGMRPGEFRHDDHKFEMSRKEFSDWLAELSVQFPHYIIEPPQFIGMTPGREALSGASQAAVCILRDNVNSQLEEFVLPYELVGHSPCRLGGRLVAFDLVRQAFLEWIEKFPFREAELRHDSFSPYWLVDIRHVLHHLHAPVTFASTIDESVACKYILGMTNHKVLTDSSHGFNGLVLRQSISKQDIIDVVRKSKN